MDAKKEETTNSEIVNRNQLILNRVSIRLQMTIQLLFQQTPALQMMAKNQER